MRAMWPRPALPWSGFRDTGRLVAAGRARLAAGTVAFVCGAVLLPGLAAWLPVIANLAACWRFASTLRPGREPLITRYTRFDNGGCPAEVAGYSRGLILTWAWFLGLFAAAHALVATGMLAGHGAHALVLAAEVTAGPALFLGEHALRNRRFPHHGRATPGRTLRAVRLAHRVPLAEPLAGHHAG